MDPIGYFFDHYLLIKFPKDFLLRNLVIPIEVVEDNILMVLQIILMMRIYCR